MKEIERQKESRGHFRRQFHLIRVLLKILLMEALLLVLAKGWWWWRRLQGVLVVLVERLSGGGGGDGVGGWVAWGVESDESAIAGAAVGADAADAVQSAAACLVVPQRERRG